MTAKQLADYPINLIINLIANAVTLAVILAIIVVATIWSTFDILRGRPSVLVRFWRY